MLLFELAKLAQEMLMTIRLTEIQNRCGESWWLSQLFSVIDETIARKLEGFIFNPNEEENFTNWCLGKANRLEIAWLDIAIPVLVIELTDFADSVNGVRIQDTDKAVPWGKMGPGSVLEKEVPLSQMHKPG